MFVNISNHPSQKWDTKQRIAAGESIRDIQFPNVSPLASTEEVTDIARNLMQKCLALGLEKDTKGRVMIQGEFSLTFELSRMMLALGWDVVVACSERKSVENNDGTKTVAFEFVQFRSLRG